MKLVLWSFRTILYARGPFEDEDEDEDEDGDQ